MFENIDIHFIHTWISLHCIHSVNGHSVLSISKQPPTKFSQKVNSIVPDAVLICTPFFGLIERAPLHGRGSPSPPPQRGGWREGQAIPSLWGGGTPALTQVSRGFS